MDKNALYKEIANSSPSIKFCNRFDGNSPLWDYSRHKHPYFEFIYHLNESVRRKLDDITLQNANVFDTVLYPVNYWHEDAPVIGKKENSDTVKEVFCIWVDIQNLKIVEPIKIQDNDGQLEHLFSSIYLEYQKKESLQELLSLQVKTLLLQILHLYEESTDTLSNRIIHYLTTHSTEKISLDALAEQEHISKSGLIKQFRLETGTTIITFLHDICLKNAKRLLVTTSKNVEEIALETGFDSPKYFHRLFKKYEGISPNAYRRLYLSRHDDSIIKP